MEFLVIYIYNCAYIIVSSLRISDRKGPPPQNGEPGNTRQQHISSKATSTLHNGVLPQKGATRTFKQEFNGHQVSSNPQQRFMDSHHHHGYQQRHEVLPQEVAVRTSRKVLVDHQATSQHNGGSGNTKHHLISSKATPSLLEYPHQPPKHHNHNEGDGLKSNFREELSDHQNNAYHSTEYDASLFQPQGKFAQHASEYQHGSNFHQNVRGGRQTHQPHRPRNQDQMNPYYATKCNDSFQPQGKFTQHANAYQRGSNSHQYAQANHQAHQPLRPRNQDFSSSDQSYGQDYCHQGYHDYRGITRGQCHPQQGRHQNYYGIRPMTQGQYRTQQNHHQNCNGHRKMYQNQYRSRQNQPQQVLEQQPQLRPCRYYYQQGWCRYGEGCWFSHDI